MSKPTPERCRQAWFDLASAAPAHVMGKEIDPGVDFVRARSTGGIGAR
jgi:hypothetical protein